MDRLIGGVQRFSTEDGPGIRTTVFFTGCPLRCQWCHNPELISRKPQLMYTEQKCLKCGSCVQICPKKALSIEDGLLKINREACDGCGKCVSACFTEALRMSSEYKEVEALTDLLAKDKGFYGETDGGITLSGGEVSCQTEYAHEVMTSCINKNMKVAIDTCGYGNCEDIEKLSKDAQVILYDIKHMDSEKHKEFTGVGNELILNNLRVLCQSPALRERIWIRIPLIHPVNDSVENMTAVCELMNELGLSRVQGIPYHAMGTSKSKKISQEPIEFEAPSEDQINKIIDIFKAHSLSISIMGKDQV